MRFIHLTIALLASALLAAPARAQDAPAADAAPPAASDARPERNEMRKQMLERFDENKDGELSEDERAAARKFREERMRERGGPDGERARQGNRPPRGPEGRGPEGRGRGRDGERPDGPPRRGPGRPDGPGGPDQPPGLPRPPAPEKVFEEFDADNNDQLSLEEFKKLTETMRQRRPPMGPPPRGQVHHEHHHHMGPPPGPGREGAREGRGRGPEGRRPGPDGRPPRPRGDRRPQGDDYRPGPPVEGADAAEPTDDTVDATERPELESPAETPESTDAAST